MRRGWIAVVAVGMLATPGASFAHDDDATPSSRTNASKLCKALRAEVGVNVFRQTYGTNRNKRNAHGKCVSKHRKAVKALIAQAVSECKTELAAQPVAQGDKGGKGEQKRALRECVKNKLRAMLAERREAFENAAQACKAERKADATAFAAKYGTNENKRNAFGKCVAKTVRANETQPQS